MFKKFSTYFIVTLIHFVASEKVEDISNLPSYFESVHPLLINGNGRIKRDFSTQENQINHYEKVSIHFYAFGRNFSLSLRKNQLLIPSTFGSFYVNGNGTVTKIKFVEHCYYHGILTNQINSRIVIDTCDGINGFVHDATTGEYFYIDSIKKDDGGHKHIVYKPEHIKTKKKKCGHKYEHGSDDVFKANVFDKGNKRYRRSSEEMKYIELLAVSDDSHVRKYGKSGSIKRLVTIMNHVDEVYKTLNTRVALIGVIAFDRNQFAVDYNSVKKTLQNFGNFVKTKIHGNAAYGNLDPDNSQFIIGRGFAGSAVGFGGVGDICGWTSSAVNHDHEGNAALTANTVAHELGHNLGFLHTGSCSCNNKPCVMLASAPHTPVQGFSECNENKWTKLTSDGDVPCVFDYPEKLYGKPKCGNGYIEKGEECDCGSEEECDAEGMTKCCDPKTCKLQASAQCATGLCCEDCKFKERGTLCRDRMHFECDFEEFCIGNSSMCPQNFYAQDGTSCDRDQALCYQGACKRITTHCKTLWGENAVKAKDICFDINKKGDRFGNCGKDDSDNYIKCKVDDRLCGKLQCTGKSPSHPLPELPIIGSNRASKQESYSDGEGKTTCIMAAMVLGKDMADPTIATDGTKCGTDKMCIKTKCTPVSQMEYIKKCKTPCLNGGVCNNNGNCHCLPGFSCPDCRYLGPGGSVDSGQGCVFIDKPTKCKNNGTNRVDICELEECGCLTPLVKGLLVLFLLVLPLLCLLIYVIWKYRRDIKSRWHSYVTGRKSPNKSSCTSKNNNVVHKKTKKKVKDTKVTDAVTYNNPNVTFNQPNKNIAISPAKSPQPLLSSSSSKNYPNKQTVPNTTYKTENLKTIPPNNGNTKLHPIGGNSPRVGKLAQVEIFNQKENGSNRTTPRAPTVSPMVQTKGGVSPKPVGKLAQIEMYNKLDSNK